MPDRSKKWRSFLVNFAAKIGKPDPEVYVDSGKWKARQGGNGLPSANDVKSDLQIVQPRIMRKYIA